MIPKTFQEFHDKIRLHAEAARVAMIYSKKHRKELSDSQHFKEQQRRREIQGLLPDINGIGTEL